MPVPPFSPNALLSPEDVTNHGLPVAIRGYDRERADRHLARVADAYGFALARASGLQERLRTLEDELNSALAEAQASARAVAELMQSAPATKAEQPSYARSALDELEARLQHSEHEREQGLADLRAAWERASELGERLAALEAEESRRLQLPAVEQQPPVTDAEAAQLLVAAARAAEDVRTAARARALQTLLKARELAALVHADVERESAALAEIQQRRHEVEREANEIRAGAQAEADRVAAELEGERNRVRGLLRGALSALDEAITAPQDDLIADLESRLHDTPEPTGK